MKNKDLINIFSLAAIHGSNALFPLIVFPYLFLVLNENEFSIIVITESIALYVLAICLYSFDVSGVKDIVHGKQNKELEKIGQTYWAILLTRLVLFMLVSVTILSCAYVFFFSYFYTLLLWMMYPLGMILQSNYYFQATETNIRLGAVIFFSRVSTSLLVYIFVKETGLGFLSTGLLAGSFLFSGLISFAYVLYSIGIRLSYFRSCDVYGNLKNGLMIFIGNFSVSLFRGSNIIILSIVSNPFAVSVYSIAEKVVKSLQALSRPLNEFSFPRIVKSIHESNGDFEASKIIWDNTKYQIFIMLFLIPILLGGLHLILHFSLWTKLDIHIVNLISIMVLAILFGIANFMYGTVGLNTLGFHRYYASSIFIAGVISLIISISLSHVFSEVGASISFVLGEGLLFIFFYLKYRSFGRLNS